LAHFERRWAGGEKGDRRQLERQFGTLTVKVHYLTSFCRDINKCKGREQCKNYWEVMNHAPKYLGRVDDCSVH
jgi:hypothetical protein